MLDMVHLGRLPLREKKSLSPSVLEEVTQTQSGKEDLCNVKG